MVCRDQISAMTKYQHLCLPFVRMVLEWLVKLVLNQIATGRMQLLWVLPKCMVLVDLLQICGHGIFKDIY